MLHFLATALLGTLVLAQQPADSVSSTELPGSVAVPSAKTKPDSTPAPKAVAQETEEAEATPPPPPPAPAEAAPVAEERPSQSAAPKPSGGKRVAAFWMMLPG